MWAIRYGKQGRPVTGQAICFPYRIAHIYRALHNQLRKQFRQHMHQIHITLHWRIQQLKQIRINTGIVRDVHPGFCPNVRPRLKPCGRLHHRNPLHRITMRSERPDISHPRIPVPRRMQQGVIPDSRFHGVTLIRPPQPQWCPQSWASLTASRSLGSISESANK